MQLNGLKKQTFNLHQKTKKQKKREVHFQGGKKQLFHTSCRSMLLKRRLNMNNLSKIEKGLDFFFKLFYLNRKLKQKLHPQRNNLILTAQISL